MFLSTNFVFKTAIPEETIFKVLLATKSHAPACILSDPVHFDYFVEPGENICHYDHWFQRRICLKPLFKAYKRNSQAPRLGDHVFWRLKFASAIFVEGHLVTISSKLF